MAAILSNVRLALGCTLPAILAFGALPVHAQETVVLVVRHAERASNAANSDLSDEGLASAAALAEAVRVFDITAVYTTDLCRTAQTGQPTARAAGVTIGILATGSEAAGLDTCTPAITVPHEVRGRATEIVDLLRGTKGAILVVGHSNTVPDLITALTGRSACPNIVPNDTRGRCMLGEDAYGDLYVVHLPDGAPSTVEHRRYH